MFFPEGCWWSCLFICSARVKIMCISCRVQPSRGWGWGAHSEVRPSSSKLGFSFAGGPAESPSHMAAAPGSARTVCVPRTWTCRFNQECVFPNSEHNLGLRDNSWLSSTHPPPGSCLRPTAIASVHRPLLQVERSSSAQERGCGHSRTDPPQENLHNLELRDQTIPRPKCQRLPWFFLKFEHLVYFQTIKMVGFEYFTFACERENLLIMSLGRSQVLLFFNWSIGKIIPE